MLKEFLAEEEKLFCFLIGILGVLRLQLSYEAVHGHFLLHHVRQSVEYQWKA